MNQCLYCERVATKKRMCHAHYMRARRGAPMDSPLAPPPGGPCSVIGCERPASERGMCHSHARRARRGTPLDTPIAERRDDGPATCTHKGCGLPSYAKGLCHGHYSRSRNPPKRPIYRYWESGLSPEWWQAVTRMRQAARPRRTTPWDTWIKSRRAGFLQPRPQPSTKVRRDRSTWKSSIRAMCQASLREAWKARRDPWDYWCERRVRSFERRKVNHECPAVSA